MKIDFARLRNPLQARSALALTIESHRIAACQVRMENGVTSLAAAFSVPYGAEDLLKAPEKAGAELALARDSAGVRERRCVVCVPPGWALTASTNLPTVSPEDLRGYLELQAEREFPLQVSELRLGFSPYSLPDGNARATLAAVPQKRLDAVEKMLAAAGLRAVSISLALDDCLAQPGAMLHFLANGNHTDLVVTGGGGVVALRSISSHSSIENASPDATAFPREIRITLGRLPEPIRRQVHQARFGGSPASARRLSLEMRDSLRAIGIDSADSGAERSPASEIPESPGAATGVAAQYLRQEPVAFEFVVPEVKEWHAMLQRFDSRRRRWIAAAVCGLVILPVLIFFIRSRIENHLQNQWDAMRDTVTDLDDLQQRIHRFRPWFESSPQSVQMMESLVTSFPDQGDVWAKSVQIGEDYKVTCTGFAKNQPALMSFLDRLRARPDIASVQLQQLRGDNPIQFSVTYKWDAHHD